MKNELVLSSNNIGVSTTKESLLKKKKKGFTLVELIAVIAILAILAAIIVPRVASYTARANTSRYLADAKTIVNAVEVYNADPNNTTKIDTSSATVNLNTIISTLTGADQLNGFTPTGEEIDAFNKGTGSITDVSYQDLLDYIAGN